MPPRLMRRPRSFLQHVRSLNPQLGARPLDRPAAPSRFAIGGPRFCYAPAVSKRGCAGAWGWACRPDRRDEAGGRPPARLPPARRRRRGGLRAALASAAASRPAQPVAPTREEIASPAARADRAAAAAADGRGRRRAGALRARPARISGHPLHLARRRRSTICAACRPRRCGPPSRPSSARSIRSRSICEIRDRAATILREAGYIAAVEVPEQRIADGTVRFQVLMARLVGLRVRGDAGRVGADHRRLSGAADRAGGVQPLRRRALSAARRRPAGL